MTGGLVCAFIWLVKEDERLAVGGFKKEERC